MKCHLLPATLDLLSTLPTIFNFPSITRYGLIYEQRTIHKIDKPHHSSNTLRHASGDRKMKSNRYSVTAVQWNIATLSLSVPTATKVLGRMPQAEDQNSRQHRQRLKNIENPFMGKRIPKYT